MKPILLAYNRSIEIVKSLANKTEKTGDNAMNEIFLFICTECQHDTDVLTRLRKNQKKLIAKAQFAIGNCRTCNEEKEGNIFKVTAMKVLHIIQ